jgi:hypothetical protein
MTRLRSAQVAAGCTALALTGCQAADGSGTPDAAGAHSEAPAGDTESTHGAGHGPGDAAPTRSRPLRDGERFLELAMPASYTPSAPTGKGTDDYRCFLLDPGLDEDAFITGIDVLPGNADVVHHVILFRVPPQSQGAAVSLDMQEEGQGWTCFGGTGVGGAGAELDDAPWLGAWAPGGGERVLAPDVGIPLEAGSQVVMQVHYNLLAGATPDVTAARLRLAPGDRDLAALDTMLLPAPVELPCRQARDDGPLCSREASLADAGERFGDAAQTANYLHLLCGRQEPGPVQRCERTIEEPTTVRAAAGHMHLLGREIRLEANPGTPRARTLLDIGTWDFDDQGARPVEPVRLEPGDRVRVTCRHDQALRDVLPAFEGQRERYVVWGDGTTDEMCLGMLMVTRP